MQANVAGNILTSEDGSRAGRELTLLVAGNKAFYLGVYLDFRKTKPYQAQVKRGGKAVSLGHFATAEEAALCIARSPEGQVAAQKAAAAPPLTSEEARQQAQAEGLTLLVSKNNTGYCGVRLEKPGQPKPYGARVKRDGKDVRLGSFATAEEAALCVARSLEGQAARRWKVGATLAAAKQAEAWAQRVQNDEVDGWSS